MKISGTHGLRIGFLALFGSLAMVACAPQLSPAPPVTQTATSSVTYGYRIVNTFPHDPEAFTQGLVFHDGFLYEGTGERGRSTLRKVDLTTGEVIQFLTLDPNLFGEGIALFNDRIAQLTLTSGIGFIYDQRSFSKQGTFNYTPEGWGLTHDGRHFIMSDGSAQLRFLDLDTFEEISRITVTDGGQPVQRLNELEYVDGEVYANIWQSDMIARISPDTGKVLGWIELSGLLGDEPAAGVLNGIAYDSEVGRLFVTGKNWPKLFEIELFSK